MQKKNRPMKIIYEIKIPTSLAIKIRYKTEKPITDIN